MTNRRRANRKGRRFAAPAFARRVLASLSAIVVAGPAIAAPLPSVASLNVCTDQLVMLLAAPGQIASLSYLADDPSLSFLHEKATGYPKNHGRAEEVFLTHPDVVVTGTYDRHDTSGLLRHLGFDVQEFAFDQTLASVPVDIRRMGEILHRQDKAEAIAKEFENGLAALESTVCGPSPTVLALEQNGVALAKGTLADSVMKAAGLSNIASDLGYTGMVPFPMEEVVETHPDIVVLRRSMANAPSLADQVEQHPALRALKDSRIGPFVPAGSWSCTGPFVLEAVKALRRLRDEISPCGAPAQADG